MKSKIVYKITLLIGSGLLAAACAVGCATQNSGSTTSATDENSAVENVTITTRTVTFPSIYFGESTQDEATATLTELGCSDIVVNENGSYTAIMPLDKYNEFVDSLHEGTKEALDGIPHSEDYPSITAIEYDETFSNVTMTSSASQLGLSEMFVNWTVGICGCMYQQIAGQPVSCTVTVLDEAGIVIQSGTYPEDWENASEKANTPEF